MKNIYSPDDIQAVMTASLGDEGSPRRRAFIRAAGMAVARHVAELQKGTDARVVIFAGDTVNGAYAMDCGTALHAMGVPAEVYLINIGNILGRDGRIAKAEFIDKVGEEYLFETVDLNGLMPALTENVIVIDGLFGREYRKALKGGYQATARRINESGATVVAIDVPSGMTESLEVGLINRNIVHADLTLTFVGPTLSFYMPENEELIGRWQILPLAYDRETLRNVRCTAHVLDLASVRKVLPERPRSADKHDLGTALLFAGSYGMSGAAVLAARAALRSGCGRTVVHGPACCYYVVQTAAPCATFESDGADRENRHFETDVNADGIGVGPGLGRAEATVKGLETFLKNCQARRKPLVIDADALNCLAASPMMLEYIPERSILTPHAGEFDRLFGNQPSCSSRLLKAVEMSRRYRVVIVLKSHFTQIVWPDGSVLVNPTGTSALATAGSGDVLTGLITGLIAQGMKPELAAVAGVYIHGLAGRTAASIHGEAGTTAEDIALAIGPAINSIVNKETK